MTEIAGEVLKQRHSRKPAWNMIHQSGGDGGILAAFKQPAGNQPEYGAVDDYPSAIPKGNYRKQNEGIGMDSAW